MAQKVNLDVISGIAGVVTIKGVEHTVLDLDGADYRIVQSEGASMVQMYDLAAKLIPTLPREEVDALKKNQLAAILAIADGRIQQVEAEFPNAFGPETDNSAAPSPAST